MTQMNANMYQAPGPNIINPTGQTPGQSIGSLQATASDRTRNREIDASQQQANSSKKLAEQQMALEQQAMQQRQQMQQAQMAQEAAMLQAKLDQEQTIAQAERKMLFDRERLGLERDRINVEAALKAAQGDYTTMEQLRTQLQEYNEKIAQYDAQSIATGGLFSYLRGDEVHAALADLTQMGIARAATASNAYRTAIELMSSIGNPSLSGDPVVNSVAGLTGGAASMVLGPGGAAAASMGSKKIMENEGVQSTLGVARGLVTAGSRGFLQLPSSESGSRSGFEQWAEGVGQALGLQSKQGTTLLDRLLRKGEELYQTSDSTQKQAIESEIRDIHGKLLDQGMDPAIFGYVMSSMLTGPSADVEGALETQEDERNQGDGQTPGQSAEDARTLRPKGSQVEARSAKNKRIKNVAAGLLSIKDPEGRTLIPAAWEDPIQDEIRAINQGIKAFFRGATADPSLDFDVIASTLASADSIEELPLPDTLKSMLLGLKPGEQKAALRVLRNVGGQVEEYIDSNLILQEAMDAAQEQGVSLDDFLMDNRDRLLSLKSDRQGVESRLGDLEQSGVTKGTVDSLMSEMEGLDELLSGYGR